MTAGDLVRWLESEGFRIKAKPGAIAIGPRGRITPGASADLVVFDAGKIEDRATALQPQLAPVGIVHVLVNGVAVVWNGRPTAARPGRALRRR